MLAGNLQQCESLIDYWQSMGTTVEHGRCSYGEALYILLHYSCSKIKKIPIKFLYHITINAIYVYTITINNMTFNN